MLAGKTIFSSKEWVRSFHEVYGESFPFLYDNQDHTPICYFDREKSCHVLPGSPFNDYWPLVDCKKEILDEGISHLRNICRKNKIKLLLENIPTEQISHFYASEMIPEITYGAKIKLGNRTAVSPRIVEQYEKAKDKLLFFRFFPSNQETFTEWLKVLLAHRHRKLNQHKKKEHNLSFEDRFDSFILKVCSSPTLSSKIYLDVSLLKESGDFCAIGLFFVENERLHYYLRAHNQKLKTRLSFGLIFDYWFQEKARKAGLETIDYGRGDEAYKFRLGAQKYQLFNVLLGQV
jgi:hypothetical protein